MRSTIAFSTPPPVCGSLSIARPSYSIELSFQPPNHAAFAARTSMVMVPLDFSNITQSSVRPNLGLVSDSGSSQPQDLLRARLSFRSRHSWRHFWDVMIDDGLPNSSHLRYNFRVSDDAVAQARTRAIPFHLIRDPDQVPGPVYLIDPSFFLKSMSIFFTKI